MDFLFVQFHSTIKQLISQIKYRIYVISGNAGTIWAPFLDE